MTTRHGVPKHARALLTEVERAVRDAIPTLYPERPLRVLAEVRLDDDGYMRTKLPYLDDEAQQSVFYTAQ